MVTLLIAGLLRSASYGVKQNCALLNCVSSESMCFSCRLLFLGSIHCFISASVSLVLFLKKLLILIASYRVVPFLSVICHNTNKRNRLDIILTHSCTCMFMYVHNLYNWAKKLFDHGWTANEKDFIKMIQ